MIQAGTIRIGSGRTLSVVGAVLDQLDELVAEHDLAGRGRNGLADDEIGVTGRRGGGAQLQPVPVPVLPAEYEILAAALERLLQHFRIGGGKIGRRKHVQQLPHRELDDGLVRRRNAAHAGRRIVPPLLAEQEGLCEHVERRTLPLRICKTPVLRFWLDQRPGALIGPKPLRGLLEQLPALRQASSDISSCRCGAAARCQAQSI